MPEDIHLLGEHSRYRIVSANRDDPRFFLQDCPTSSSLEEFSMAHVGLMEMQAPFQITRNKQGGLFFIATVKGEGQVLVDGRWTRCSANQACILPPFVHNSFRCLPHTPWQFAYVRYAAGETRTPHMLASTPLMTRYPSQAFWHAVSGLYHEAYALQHESEPRVGVTHSLRLWTEIMDQYVRSFIDHCQGDDRLNALWNLVDSKLHEPWTVETLAKSVNVSGEHLRRLCIQKLGRSPMRQVAFLRMRHASKLLTTTDEKTDTIAKLVGYSSNSVFCKVFKRWIGWPPSEHRIRQNSDALD